LSAYDPERDGRIGEYLVRVGAIDRMGLADAIAAQRRIAAGAEA
jgi:hypothetical protein